MLIDDIHFLRPVWLLALLPICVLVWRWIVRTQTESGWQSAIDDRLLAVLLDNRHQGSNRWLGNSLLFAMLCTCLALAGPAWEKLPQSVQQKNDALVILLDLSLSMLAEDVQPSRIERARQKVTDILRLRTEGLTGLIAYAGDAHAVAPLTDDTATIENLLGSLGPEMMPVAGSNPNHALLLARELFANSLLQQGRIIMITDGIDSINSVSQHRSPAFPISIIGIGSEAGGAIPLDKLRQPGRVLRTQEGNQVIALLDHTRLRDVANLTYGEYAPAVIDDSDIILAMSPPLPGEDDTLDVEREFDTWYDQGHWLILPLLPLFLWYFRKGVLLSAPLLCAALLSGSLLHAPLANAETPAANAGTPTASPPSPTTVPPAASRTSTMTAINNWWDSLWLNEDQRAHKALRHGEPEKAAALFNHPLWQAAARYRSGDYTGALQGYTADSSSTGKYNQANSLARMGEYEKAINLYTEVLAKQPDHEDAGFNNTLVKKLLQEQQEAEQQQAQQQDQTNNPESDSEQEQQQQQQEQSAQEETAEDAEQRQQQADNEEEEEQQGEQQQLAQAEQDETTRDEKQEALEQWLRRVPDNPGGLLRRKFEHEYKQRLRRGEYEHRQGDKVW